MWVTLGLCKFDTLCSYFLNPYYSTFFLFFTFYVLFYVGIESFLKNIILIVL